jgi:LmbE family N-acetylglucosaminyl deacetylase
MIGLRSATRHVLNGRLQHRLQPFTQREWMASALIIAPHADDETLGCGGIACKKIRNGAPTHFLFVTDGAASHGNLADKNALSARRESEARLAVARLGGSNGDLTFLRFPDGDANRHIDAIAEAIARSLRTLRPDCIYIPHVNDFTSDHAAVHAAARKAAAVHGRRMHVYEYPVWYWYHWPWVRLGGQAPGLRRAVFRQSLKTRFGLSAPYALNRRAYVGDVLTSKRAALDAHASQTRQDANDPNRATLGDLAGGDFLRRLMSDYEAFNCYEVNA